jgi:hypothetical protein
MYFNIFAKTCFCDNNSGFSSNLYCLKRSSFSVCDFKLGLKCRI